MTTHFRIGAIGLLSAIAFFVATCLIGQRLTDFLTPSMGLFAWCACFALIIVALFVAAIELSRAMGGVAGYLSWWIIAGMSGWVSVSALLLASLGLGIGETLVPEGIFSIFVSLILAGGFIGFAALIVIAFKLGRSLVTAEAVVPQ